MTIKAPIAEGETIAGKYVVGQTLAAGGMGVVCEGRHATLDQRVAIKFLLPDVTRHPEAVERFVREAKAAAKIDSDHVVRVLDVGSQGDVPYLVMEFLEGIDLEGYIELKGKLAPEVAIDFLCQALEGLALAHEAGIVHRDLKPSNLFLASRGKSRPRVKVLDFGISKVMPAGQADPSLTSTKSLLGSPGYMSPEQVRSSKNVDTRSDVWSMGVILWEMLSGEKAYDGETLGDIFAKIREEPLPAIRRLRPDVSPELEAVVSRCLERDRDRRFADAGSLLEALRELRSPSSEVLSAPVSEAIAARTALGEAATVATDVPDRADRPASRTHASWATGDAASSSKRTLVGVVGAVVVVGAIGGWLATRGGTDAKGSAANDAQPTSTTQAQPQGGGGAPGPRVVPTEATTASAHPSATAAAASVTAPNSSVRATASLSATARASTIAPPRPTTSAPPAASKKKDDLGI